MDCVELWRQLFYAVTLDERYNFPGPSKHFLYSLNSLGLVTLIVSIV